MLKNRVLILITVILTAFYLVSFTKSYSSQDKREKIKTALVNPKNKDSIYKIELSDASGNISLVNKNGFWQVEFTSDSGNQIISYPAGKERIENLIENLSKVRNLYKISDKINKNNSLGLTNGTEFHLRYYYDQAFHELIFGNQDFSLSARYLMTDKNTQVYESDNQLDTYLTTSVQSWTEPYLVSRNIVANGLLNAQNIQKITVFESKNGKKSAKLIEDFSKFLELRHGGIPDFIPSISDTEPVMALNIEIGNKDYVVMEIYAQNQLLQNSQISAVTEDNSYFVVNKYYKASSSAAFYTSYSKISGWTYNRISEMTL